MKIMILTKNMAEISSLNRRKSNLLPCTEIDKIKKKVDNSRRKSTSLRMAITEGATSQRTSEVEEEVSEVTRRDLKEAIEVREADLEEEAIIIEAEEVTTKTDNM